MDEDEVADAPVAEAPNQAEIDAYEALSPERREGVPVPAGYKPAEAAAPAAAKPAVEPEAPPAETATAPSAAPDRLAKIAELLDEHKVDPDQFAANLRETIGKQAQQLTQEEREAEIERRTEKTLARIGARLDALGGVDNASEEDLAAARDDYLAAREAAAIAIENEQLKAQLSERDRATALDRVRAEFPDAPADALERYAAMGASADQVREMADTLHKAVVAARDRAVAGYVAQKGGKREEAAVFAPAGGASPTIEPSGPSWQDVRNRSWGEVLDKG